MKTNDLGTRIICALMTLLFAFSVSCADQSEEISQTSIGTSIEDSSEASIESTDEKDEIISYIYDNYIQKGYKVLLIKPSFNRYGS